MDLPLRASATMEPFPSQKLLSRKHQTPHYKNDPAGKQLFALARMRAQRCTPPNPAGQTGSIPLLAGSTPRNVVARGGRGGNTAQLRTQDPQGLGQLWVDGDSRTRGHPRGP